MMGRSQSVKISTNQRLPNVAGPGSTNSLHNLTAKDHSKIQIEFDTSKVSFTKNSSALKNTKVDQHSKFENRLLEATENIPTEHLLSVNMSCTNNNTSARGSISTLDGNIDLSRTYLHAPSMVSCGTENTAASMDNAETGNDEETIPLRQRDSSGSIRAAVARRKQNMTHRSAAQKREANLAVVLVSSVTMFLICHAPRIFANL